MDNELLQSQVEWLQSKMEKMQYGTVAIRITVHDGQVREISRELQEKFR